MTDPYSNRAHHFFSQYQQLAFDDVHQSWLHHLPDHPGFALDVGAGSGRDATALAERAWEVIAVEPATELRRLGEQATEKLAVQWLDDSLPELTRVRAQSYRFDLILVSAVWMHIPPNQRQRAFRLLTELLAPNGTLVITLRHGPGDGERTFYETSRQELEGLARNRALIPLSTPEATERDRMGRDTVSWETCVFRLPDDGTGSLPLLRHIIVNDDKSSSYKLGLLRTLTRIADGLPGMVIRRTDEWVDIPLGLVGLYWIKLYQPLILHHHLRQAPGNRGYGFAGKDFYALQNVSPLDMRPGQRLNAELGPTLLRAIKDAVQNILKNPAHFTTWPGTTRPVFDADPQRTRIRKEPVILSRDVLAEFGTFRIPALLWDCFSRFACWLEPAIIHEWSQLMQSYEARYTTDIFMTALQWQENKRDTSEVRNIVDACLQQQQKIHCVWSQRRLQKRHFEIDHCFPWSRWANNDLWNLMPATVQANAAKSEKLPAASLLKTAKPDILEWWDTAFFGTDYERRFLTEAQAALPVAGEKPNAEVLFEGMVHQRMRLRMNQQLAEWHGLNMA